MLELSFTHKLSLQIFLFNGMLYYVLYTDTEINLVMSLTN